MSCKCSCGALFGCFIHLCITSTPKPKPAVYRIFILMDGCYVVRSKYLNNTGFKNGNTCSKTGQAPRNCEKHHIWANKRKRKSGFQFPWTQYFSKYRPQKAALEKFKGAEGTWEDFLEFSFTSRKTPKIQITLIRIFVIFHIPKRIFSKTKIMFNRICQRRKNQYGARRLSTFLRQFHLIVKTQHNVRLH